MFFFMIPHLKQHFKLTHNHRPHVSGKRLSLCKKKNSCEDLGAELFIAI